MQAMDTAWHPNIISLMAVSSIDTHVYIVMEYFDSCSLKDSIKNRNSKIKDPEKKNRNYYICLQISKAIAYLHELIPKIIHKDIKPEKILINKHLIIKICDLGLSRICDLSLSALRTTIGHNLCGTPMYMAPEILVHNLPAKKSIWNVQPFTISRLKQVISSEVKPDLERIPINLHNDISACFNNNPNGRPKAVTLVKVLERLWDGYRY
ncbi:serine/threonine-protein kinase Nek7-like [Chelonus insularis]|uniref:serine/threonine-protein kinase Nek7-like n=1 Tax=Chelonus insularis TaxID=460826 RepID=UPI0015894170|nr:serine/threonine-protein kinase Nek7-like [Chelonus insularis]